MKTGIEEAKMIVLWEKTCVMKGRSEDKTTNNSKNT
jgi:hypothetical protein